MKWLVKRFKQWEPWSEEKITRMERYIRSLKGQVFSIEDLVLAYLLVVHQIKPKSIKTEADYEKVERGIRQRVTGRYHVHGPAHQFISENDVVVPVEVHEKLLAMYVSYGAIPDDPIYDLLVYNQVVQSFSTLYKKVVVGHQHRFQNVKGIAPENETCPLALTQFKNVKYPIDEVIAAYQEADADGPILPNPRCPYFQRDGGGWCRCSWLPVDRIENQRVDPDFKTWLDAKLSN